MTEEKKRKENKEEPTKLKHPFLVDTKGILKKEEVPKEQFREFVLLLMKNNGMYEFIEGVQAGEFLMKSQSTGQEKSILLTPNKIGTFKYNKQYFKGWIAHEDSMTPYPQNPLHNAEMYRKTIQKVAMNYRDANEAKMVLANAKAKMMMIGVGVLALYILYIVSKNAGWFDGGNDAVVTEVVINTTKEVVRNTTGVNVG